MLFFNILIFQGSFLWILMEFDRIFFISVLYVFVKFFYVYVFLYCTISSIISSIVFSKWHTLQLLIFILICQPVILLNSFSFLKQYIYFYNYILYIHIPVYIYVHIRYFQDTHYISNNNIYFLLLHVSSWIQHIKFTVLFYS